MKKVLFSAALLMGFAVVSFAGNPKDGKTTNENATETKAGQQLYWYKVSYATDANGVVPPGANLEAHDTQENAEGLSICELGTERDCMRGFSSPQPSGSSLPGDGQIKTDEEL